jgi:hypothetical protein
VDLLLWPIKNADSINIRRKEAGFQQTIEEYAKEMDVDLLYKINELKGYKLPPSAQHPFNELSAIWRNF